MSKNKKVSTTHDFRRCYWGHNVSFTVDKKNNKLIDGFIWHWELISVGDFLLLERDGNLFRYKVTETTWIRDPSDMTGFKAEFSKPDNKEEAEIMLQLSL